MKFIFMNDSNEEIEKEIAEQLSRESAKVAR